MRVELGCESEMVVFGIQELEVVSITFYVP